MFARHPHVLVPQAVVTCFKKPHNLHDSCEPTSLADVRPKFSYASLMLLMSLFFFHLSISRSPFQSQEGFGNHLLSKSLNATWLQLDEAVGSSNPKWTGHDPPQFIAIHCNSLQFMWELALVMQTLVGASLVTKLPSPYCSTSLGYSNSLVDIRLSSRPGPSAHVDQLTQLILVDI